MIETFLFIAAVVVIGSAVIAIMLWFVLRRFVGDFLGGRPSRPIAPGCGFRRIRHPVRRDRASLL